jgi:hypothetical protein
MFYTNTRSASSVFLGQGKGYRRLTVWERYKAWTLTAQGAWVLAAIFALLALFNALTGNWILTAAMAGVGVTMVIRGWSRVRNR